MLSKELSVRHLESDQISNFVPMLTYFSTALNRKLGLAQTQIQFNDKSEA